MITKVVIRNYRKFRSFQIELSPGLNVLVGRNDCGKSTLIQAIVLALTGRLNGRPLEMELSPYLVNRDSISEFAAALAQGTIATPPEVLIDLYLHANDLTE